MEHLACSPWVAGVQSKSFLVRTEAGFTEIQDHLLVVLHMQATVLSAR